MRSSVEQRGRSRKNGSIAAVDPDHAMRQAALAHARELAQVFHEIVPLRVLREGFTFDGEGSPEQSDNRALRAAGELQAPLIYLLGIDPKGIVHIGQRLLDEQDGPMLRTGLQGFHGAPIGQSRRPEERPDPGRLAIRFGEFEDAA